MRFALAAGSPHGLNVHVVGVVLILAGVLGLLLSLLTRDPRRRNRPGGADPDAPTLTRQRPFADQATPAEDRRAYYQDQPPT